MENLNRHMLCITGAPSVSHHPQAASAYKALRHFLAELADVIRVSLKKLILDLNRLSAFAHYFVMPFLRRDRRGSTHRIRTHAAPPSSAWAAASAFCLSKWRPYA